jgi:hypothetical protein
MAIFNSGHHSFNKKYERFSDVYKLSAKYRRRTRSRRPNKRESDSSDEVFVPSRREKFGGKKVTLWKRIWSIFPLKYIARLFGKFSERMRAIRETRASARLGYIPTKLFLGLCLVTCGLYPYMWMWGNTYAFNTVGGRRINEGSIKRLAVLGFVVQLLLPISAASHIAWRLTGHEVAFEARRIAILVFLSLYFLVVFPMRCFNYFSIRWAVRGAVIDWDNEGVMVGRTITSWIKLFLLGSVYIQYHINRLMGLGMPGFADASEIEPDVSLTEIIDGYVVLGRSDRSSASWTKDDFEPEYDDEPDEYEEYDG